MVSYGCIVYSCDHTDLSCATYMDHNTSEEVKYQEYDFSQGNQETQEEYRYKQLDIRVNKDIANIIELIKEEAQPDFLPCIDLEKLTAFGHSMGAMTAVHAAYTFSEDFKLCLAMDIYFKAMYQHIEGNDDYALTQPICISTSQTFHELSTDKYKSGYNCNATRNQFYMNCAEENGKRNYNLVIPDSTHTNQEDQSVLLYLSLQRDGSILKTSDPHDKLQQFIHINVAFLDENEFLPIKFRKTVKDVVQG